ncbi:MAG: lytic transglycosylase domain-containing protein [Elusimicrobia bacterium]|nr:lytic transglycosylase domain-containing protein [Elusimicrobiota bacterium]MBU2614504.1 lytic transglycosylase domain-containing protein [Elusimicrobiota bacterium]
MKNCLCLVILLNMAVCADSKPKIEFEYDDIIIFHAAQNYVDPFLVKAVIKVESGFNYKCISCKGAKGLMQLMPGVGQMQGVRNIFDPYENIGAGTRHLAILLDLYNENLDKAIAAYNAGIGAVARYKGIPPYPETRDFVAKVKKYYKKYRSTHYIRRRNIQSFKDSTGYMYFFNE